MNEYIIIYHSDDRSDAGSDGLDRGREESRAATIDLLLDTWRRRTEWFVKVNENSKMARQNN